MEKIRFAMLGKKNSGKTSLIAAEQGHVNGLELVLTNTKQGDSYVHNQFQLQTQSKSFLEFEIIDYSGELLRERDDNTEAFSQIEKSIYNANVIYVLIDGELLTGNDKEIKLKNVKRNCARTIMPYLSNCSVKNNGFLPLVIFVITKTKLYINNTSNSEILEILEEAFSSIFSRGNNYYVLGFDSENLISTKVPFLLGAYSIICKQCDRKKEQLQLENESLQKQIADNKENLEEEKEKFFKSQKKINAYQQQINKDTEKIKINIRTINSQESQISIIWNSLAKELSKNRAYLIARFDELLNLIPVTQTSKKRSPIYILFILPIVILGVFIIRHFILLGILKVIREMLMNLFIQ